MLLEMQNAMNNMMSSSSSQLHSMLQGPAPGGSPPPSSSSDSSSCSGPSSPQCPQDSESVVSMDTSSSSASSCGSDSGEDEAGVSAGGRRADAFAYRQQGQSQASRTLVAVPTEAGCEDPAEQEGWNCWNNNAAVEGYRRRSHSPQVLNAAFREQQQRSSAPCREPAGDARSWQEVKGLSGSRGQQEASSCLGHRTRLVTDFLITQDVVLNRSFIYLLPSSCPAQICPMNASPYVSPNKSSQEIWEEFSMSFTPAVQEVVDFAKRIPGFRDLPEHDQVSLLKAGTFEVRREDPGGSSCSHTLTHTQS